VDITDWMSETSYIRASIIAGCRHVYRPVLATAVVSSGELQTVHWGYCFISYCLFYCATENICGRYSVFRDKNETAVLAKCSMKAQQLDLMRVKAKGNNICPKLHSLREVHNGISYISKSLLSVTARQRESSLFPRYLWLPSLKSSIFTDIVPYSSYVNQSFWG
jgi:hypothetical protein